MIRLLALLLLPLLLAGCEVALVSAVSGSAYTAFEDRRTAGTQLEDEGIEVRAGNRVEERFPKAHVSINSFNRWVLLTGEVPDEATRVEVERVVSAVQNVRGVANELQVAGVSSLASRANDSFITSKVKARMVDSNRKVNPVHVKVVTEASVVYLMGVLTETEANEAVDVARTTGGVRKVVKIFESCKPTEDPCKPRPPPAESKPAKPVAAR